MLLITILSCLAVSALGNGFFGGLGGISSPCASSNQCMGVAVCVERVCECPAPLYRAVGGACQTVTYNTIQAVPAVRTTIVYGCPGCPCGQANACSGGGSCMSGVCGCGPGLILQGSSCGPAPVAAPAIGFGGFGGGFGGFGGYSGGFGGFGGYSGGFGGGCGSPCAPPTVCVVNTCQCPNGYVAMAGKCGPPVPVVQVGPGGPCAGGEECTGGSVCQGGACCCPDMLIQIGAMCVLPPPPPPPPQMIVQQTVMIAPGNPCVAHTQCVTGASCQMGSCACGGGFYAAGGGCLRKCE